MLAPKWCVSLISNSPVSLLASIDISCLGGKISVLSYAFRYTMPKWIFATTLGSNAIHCTYYHKVADHMQLGVELDSNFRMQEVNASLAYQAVSLLFWSVTWCYRRYRRLVSLYEPRATRTGRSARLWRRNSATIRHLRSHSAPSSTITKRKDGSASACC